MGVLVNKHKLQQILGKDHKTILKLQKEGMPVEKEGARGQSHTFDTAKVIDWLVNRASGRDRLEEARIRHTLAQAEKVELEIEELRGDLISLDKMKGMWGNVLATFRARILSMPSRLTPLIVTHKDPKQIEKVIKDSCNEALNELSQYDPSTDHKRKGRRAGSNKGSSTATTT